MKSRLFFVLSLFCSAPLMADSAADSLQQKLGVISSFQASFKQQVTDHQQQLLQEGQGQLYLKQPAKFRFETSEPEPNLFIGDGTSLWHYNELLEQLSIYDAATEVNRTPFVLLTSKDAELWQQYAVEQQGEQFTIRSLDKDNPVQQLVLNFSGDALSRMTVIDSNQQQSRFDFITVELNRPVPDELFIFIPGSDIDIDDQR